MSLAFLFPFFGTILSIGASLLSMLNTATLWLGPVLSALASLAITLATWFFQGLLAIFTAPKVLLVVGTAFAYGVYFEYERGYTDCVAQVTIQKQYDAAHPPKIHRPLTKRKQTSSLLDSTSI